MITLRTNAVVDGLTVRGKPSVDIRHMNVSHSYRR